MVSPVRVRVPPLPAFSGSFLFKPQIGSFSEADFGSYSSLFWSFRGDVAVRVAVKTAVTGELLGLSQVRNEVGAGEHLAILVRSGLRRVLNRISIHRSKNSPRSMRPHRRTNSTSLVTTTYTVSRYTPILITSTCTTGEPENSCQEPPSG
jgi:hypothetical protein